MKLVFADTFYWVALLNERDEWHYRVIKVSKTLDGVTIVTTDEVLSEVLNFLSTYGERMRLRTVTLIQDIMDNRNIQVIQQTHASFLEGLDLYKNHFIGLFVV